MQKPAGDHEVLAAMHDVVAPEPVSRALEGVGWIVLAAIVLIVMATLVWRAVRRWRANAYRRAALNELALVESRVGERNAAPALAALVKRTALAARTRDDVAQLSGDRWLEELDSMWSRDVFRQGDGRVLLDAAYRDDVDEADLRKAIGVVRDWIRGHHAGV